MSISLPKLVLGFKNPKNHQQFYQNYQQNVIGEDSEYEYIYEYEEEEEEENEGFQYSSDEEGKMQFPGVEINNTNIYNQNQYLNNNENVSDSFYPQKKT